MTSAPLLPPSLLARLAAFSLAARHPAGILPGGRRSAGHPGAGTLFRDHRAYVHGDDLRYVDWNAFARHDVLVTKRFEAEEAARVVLVLDASASMASGDPRRFRAAQRALAVIGAVALARDDVVEFLAVPGARARTFRGGGQARLLVDAIAAVRPGGPTDLAEGFRTGLNPARGRSLAFVASDFHDPRGAFAGVDTLRRRGWEVRALQPVAPSDLEPPPAGPVLLVDAETGEEREWDLDERERDRLREAARRRLRGLRAAFRHRRVPWVRLPVDDDATGVLLAVLRRGGVLA